MDSSMLRENASSHHDVNKAQLSLEATVDFNRPASDNGEFLESFDFQDFLLLLSERNKNGNVSGSFGGFNLASLLNSTGSGGASDYNNFRIILEYLNVYLTPVIIFVGIVGNTLSLSVFSLTHLQRLSSSLYLSTLSVADIVFLLALLVIWLERIDCRLFSREGWCQTVHYANKVSGFMAAWSVVSFTSERYITVYHPLCKDKLCSKDKARRVVILISLVALAFYAFTIWTYDVIRVRGLPGPVCAPIPGRHYLMTAMTSLDLVFSCLIPSVVIVVLNVRIIVKIHRYQKQSFSDGGGGYGFVNMGSTTARAAAAAAHLNLTDPAAAATRRRSLVQTSVSANGSMHIKFTSSTAKPGQMRHCVLAVTPPPPGQSGKAGLLDERVKKLVRGQTQYRTARMLLTLSSVTVLFNLPTHVFRVHSLVQELFGVSEKASRAKFLWQEVFQLLYFSNFAVNFFVYSACGRQFRTGLNRLRERLKLNVNKCISGLFYEACRRGKRRKKDHKRKTRGAPRRHKENL